MTKRACEACGKSLEGKSARAKFCGSVCRTRATRARKAGRPLAPVVPLEPEKPADVDEGHLSAGRREPGLVTATRAELEKVGRLDSILGQQALILAHRVTSVMETGSAVSSLSKELRAVMAEALRGVSAGDKIDELTRRRLEKRTGSAG